jgi:CheY-like chemotaxis protein
MARILLIDDNKLVQESLSEVLAAKGHEVSMADNGKEGLKLSQHQTFDLVITDLVMPEVEGIEVILNVLTAQPKLPIIAISGGGMYADSDVYLEDAKLLGAMLTLEKPIENDRLIEAVNQCLAA